MQRRMGREGTPLRLQVRVELLGTRGRGLWRHRRACRGALWSPVAEAAASPWTVGVGQGWPPKMSLEGSRDLVDSPPSPPAIDHKQLAENRSPT